MAAAEETAAATRAMAAAEEAKGIAEVRARVAEEASTISSFAAEAAEEAAKRAAELTTTVADLESALASERAGRREEVAAAEARDAALQGELLAARDEHRALLVSQASHTHEVGEAEAALRKAVGSLEGERDHWKGAHDTLLGELRALREEGESARRDSTDEVQTLRRRLEAAEQAVVAADRKAEAHARRTAEETERAERAERLSQVQTPGSPELGATPAATPLGSVRSGASSPLGAVLPSPAQALDALSVAIPSAMRQSGEGHWSYCVAVGCGGVTYRVLKRYSDFKRTHERMLTSGVAARWMGAFPALPPKRGWSTQDERFAERRRGELQAYLAALVSEPETRACAELQGFLELGLLLRRDQREG